MIRDLPLLCTIALLFALHRMVTVARSSHPWKRSLAWIYASAAVASLVITSTSHLNNAFDDMAPHTPLPRFMVHSGAFAFWAAIVQWPLLLAASAVEARDVSLTVLCIVLGGIMIATALRWRTITWVACATDRARHK